VLYSPIQMAADLPENYARFPRPFQFIKDVPVDWADTRVLNGEVGDYVTIVRKDRNSDDWYLGAISDEQPRTLRVSLEFLDEGRKYQATIYRDGKGAGFAGDPASIEISNRPVSRNDLLTLELAPGGGQAIRIAARRERAVKRPPAKPPAKPKTEFDVE
jgi:alpha-glucosidase